MPNPDPDIIPKAIWEGTVTIAGVTLRCYMLDNHQRIFNADDVQEFYEKMLSDDGPDLTDEELVPLAEFVNGAFDA